MDRIPLDVRTELFSNGTRLCFGGIGCAHHFAKPLDGIVGFQHHQDDGTFRHEFHEAAKKRPLFVHVVEALSLRFAEVEHLHRANSKSFFLEFADDGAGISGFHGVGLENRKCFHFKLACIASPISAGLFTTRIPAASIAAIFSVAVPLPPATMAPA